MTLKPVKSLSGSAFNENSNCVDQPLSSIGKMPNRTKKL